MKIKLNLLHSKSGVKKFSTFDKHFFLMEKYHTLLEIKGFSHDFNNSLTIASVCHIDTKSPPCMPSPLESERAFK